MVLTIHFKSQYKALYVLKVASFLVILHTFHVKMALSILAESDGEVKDDESQNKFCGTISSSTGKRVKFRQGIPLPDREYEKLHTGKLKNAEIVPETNCAINVCGFSSWGQVLEDRFIGTTGDYMDCQLFESRTRTDVGIYTDKFNTSSLNCGCMKRKEDCAYNCTLRASKITWHENDCAVMFEERNCNSCYFRPIYLSSGENYVKKHVHHIFSMVVREDCYVEQQIPAFARMYRFRNFPQPIIYEGGPWERDDVWSAYQNDHETYRCMCGIPPPVPTISVLTTTKKTENDTTPDQRVGTYVVIGVVIAVILAAILNVGVLMWRKRSRQMSVSESRGSVDGFAIWQNEYNNVCSVGNFVQRGSFTIPKKSLENPLGTGTFGIVYKASLRHESDGLYEVVAVKTLRWSGASDGTVRSFLREIKTYQNIGTGDKNILRFLGACCDKDGLFLLTEFCEGGSLKEHLDQMRNEVLGRTKECHQGYVFTGREIDERELCKLNLWSEQIAEGMEYLSSKGIIHVDLAARNILLKEGNIKICDFGLSKEFCARSLVTGDFPLNSFAPELNKENPSGPKQLTAYVDIWAYGCTVYEVFTLGDTLYPDVFELREVSRLLSEGYRHPRPHFDPGYVHEILLKCWNEEPEKRPNFSYLREFFHDKALETGNENGFT